MPDDPSNRSGGSLTAATSTGNSGHGAASGSDQFVLIRIEGMHCHRCEQAIKKSLQRKPGVHEAEVDFASGQASILFDPKSISVGELIDGVKEAGYKPVGFTRSQNDPHADTSSAQG
jgi:copper chaperone CopZ